MNCKCLEAAAKVCEDVEKQYNWRSGRGHAAERAGNVIRALPCQCEAAELRKKIHDYEISVSFSTMGAYKRENESLRRKVTELERHAEAMATPFFETPVTESLLDKLRKAVIEYREWKAQEAK